MAEVGNTLGPAYNEQVDAKKTARCRRVLIVTELFNIAVNEFDAKKSTRCRRVLVVTELVVSETQYICIVAGSCIYQFGVFEVVFHVVRHVLYRCELFVHVVQTLTDRVLGSDP